MAYNITDEDFEDVAPHLVSPKKDQQNNQVTAQDNNEQAPLYDKERLAQFIQALKPTYRSAQDVKAGLGGFMRGADVALEDIGGNLQNIHDNSYLTDSIKDFLQKQNPQVVAPAQELGKMAPFAMLPGGLGEALAGKLGTGVLGSMAKGAIDVGAPSAAIAAGQGENPLTQGAIGASLGGLIPGTIGTALRAGKAVFANPEKAKLVSSGLYNQAIHEPEAQGAVINPKSYRDYLQATIDEASKKASMSAQVKKDIAMQLMKHMKDANITTKMLPSDAHDLIKDLRAAASATAIKGNLASPEAALRPNLPLASEFGQMANNLEHDLLGGLQRKGHSEAVQKYKEANEYYRKNVAPLRAYPVNKGILSAQAVASPIMKAAGVSPMKQILAELMAPEVLQTGNPAINVLRRMGSEMPTNLNPQLLQAISRILPPSLAARKVGQ